MLYQLSYTREDKCAKSEISEKRTMRKLGRGRSQDEPGGFILHPSSFSSVVADGFEPP
jgi:hypothetical protein